MSISSTVLLSGFIPLFRSLHFKLLRILLSDLAPVLKPCHNAMPVCQYFLANPLSGFDKFPQLLQRMRYW